MNPNSKYTLNRYIKYPFYTVLSVLRILCADLRKKSGQLSSSYVLAFSNFRIVTNVNEGVLTRVRSKYKGRKKINENHDYNYYRYKKIFVLA